MVPRGLCTCTVNHLFIKMTNYFSSKRPERSRHFIKTEDYNKCLELSIRAPVGVIVGPLGIGKRYTARQVIRERMQNIDEKLRCFFQINCSSANPAAEFPTACSLPVDWSMSDLSKLLLKTFHEMNKDNAGMHKFVLLDMTKLDAEKVASEFLEQLLEEFCEILANNEELKKKWTILVAVTKADKINPQLFPQIGADNFIDFRGFADVKYIEEMIKREYPKECDADVNYAHDCAKIIHNKLKLTLPVVIEVLVTDLRSYENSKEFSRRYMTTSRKNAAFNQHQTIIEVTKLNINHCLAGSGIDIQHQKRFVAMLSLIDGVNMPQDLLAAFVECLPYDPTIYEASPVARKLMSSLCDGDLCSREPKSTAGRPMHSVYTVRSFHHQTMGCYLHEFGEMERLNILKDVLVALIRRMPKDGCYCDSDKIKCFYSHAVKVDYKVDSMLSELKAYCSDQFHNIMRILQSALVTSMGYCLVSLGKSAMAEKCFKQALNLYSEAVSGSTYTPFVHYREFYSPETATKLYHSGQNAKLTLSPVFEDYIKDISRFHVLTQTCQHGMRDVIDSDDIVDDHLVPRGLEKLLRAGRVVHKPNDTQSEKVADMEKLLKVHMAELLANIYYNWSKLYLRLHSIAGETLERSKGDYNQLADNAVEVCTLVWQNQNVYLLQRIISFRISLTFQLLSVESFEDGDRIFNDWVGVRGDPAQNRQRAAGDPVSPMRTEVFECGIAKCYLETDRYHELCCLKGKLLTVGKKLARNRECPDLVQLGQQLMEDIKRIIESTDTSLRPDRESLPDDGEDEENEEEADDPLPRHLALSKAYRAFARYHFDCQAYAESIKCVIKSMEELRLSAGAKIDPNQLTFLHLLKELELYCRHCSSSGNSLPVLTGVELNCVQDLLNNIKPLRGNTQAGGGPHMELIDSLAGFFAQQLIVQDAQCVQARGPLDNPQQVTAEHVQGMNAQSFHDDDEYGVQFTS